MRTLTVHSLRRASGQTSCSLVPQCGSASPTVSLRRRIVCRACFASAGRYL